jgi:hypothetical protein
MVAGSPRHHPRLPADAAARVSTLKQFRLGPSRQVAELTRPNERWSVPASPHPNVQPPDWLRTSASSSPSATSNAACRTAERLPAKTRLSVRHAPSRRAKPKRTRPTGFVGVAPSGPAIPVTEIARSTGARAMALAPLPPRSRRLSRRARQAFRMELPATLTSPRSNRSQTRVRRRQKNPRWPLGPRGEPAGAGFRCRKIPAPAAAGVQNRLRESEGFSSEHRLLRRLPTGWIAPG